MPRAVGILVLALAGCASVAEPSTIADAAPDAFDAFDTMKSPACPPSPPTAGSSCLGYDSFCSYGDELLPDCRRVFRCTDGRPWTELPRCRLSASCPATPTEGAPCDARGERCGYDDGSHCVCRFDVSQGLHCAPPPKDARCPRIAPNAGTTCGSEGLRCGYDVSLLCGDCNSAGYSAECREGIWRWSYFYGGP